ncbi:hypothetical protein [Ectobacillus funiculus]|uniref:RsbT co-antagonist protein RsbRD N-terminal domain-containing protein n=1 Tax=Ectobacillus funiculus TaxID=137993 RepID=A0ABV5WPA7_9BACI
MTFSKHDLIGAELEAEEAINAWQRFKNDLAKRRKLTLCIDVPALLLLRCRSLVRMIEDDSFQHEVSDVFDILIGQWKQQYAETIDPQRMAGSLLAIQEKTVHHYTGEKSIIKRNHGRFKVAKIAIAYESLLDLEFICESLTSAYNEEDVLFTVEGVLSSLFVDFMNRIQKGDIKNLARILSAHAREGEAV